MRTLIVLSLLLSANRAVAQDAGSPSIEANINKLRSANFQVRQAATEALKNRPDAAPALREALRSDDGETKRRAQAILEYFDRQGVRDLENTLKVGRFLDFVKATTAWPNGQFEAEAWYVVRNWAASLNDRHQKLKGEKIDLWAYRPKEGAVPPLLVKHVTEKTQVKGDDIAYIRATEVDLDVGRLGLGAARQNPFTETCPAIVAANSVRMVCCKSHVIFAGGSVDLQDGGICICDSIIVSGGDIRLSCFLHRSLVIARGKVVLTGYAEGSRIVSGSSIELNLNGDPKVPNIITENDQNPLGFIRWANAPKKSAK